MFIKNGRQRMKMIRSMALKPEDELLLLVLERRQRYQKMRAGVGGMEVPDFLLQASFSLWHDTEYALSIRQGLYDPKSLLIQRILRSVHNKMAKELTAQDLDVLRRCTLKVLENFSEEIPLEFGCVIRFLGENEII